MFKKTKDSLRSKLSEGAISKLNPETALRFIAVNLKINLNLLKAFLKVESSGKHFNDSGRIVIRFEPHIFKRYSKKYKSKDWKDVQHGNQVYEYNSFMKAIKLDKKSGFTSISMGSAQIMGFNHKRCGFKDAESMYNAFRKSAVEGIMAFGEFIRTDKKLLKGCQDKDFDKMAKYYNGAGYKKNVDSKGKNYADKIKDQYIAITNAA